jgi:hypothetical protein
MTQEVAYRFMEALNALEQHGQTEPILDTFSEACDLANSSSPDPLQGKSGAREYWLRYRNGFREIRSTIRHIITGDHSIALEWTTNAVDRSGKQIQYEGVSILDTRGGAIVRFRAYFDTRHLNEKISPQSARIPLTTTANASSA